MRTDQKITKITISDFRLLSEMIKAMKKTTPAAKFTASENGLTAYVKNSFSRIVFSTNAAKADSEASFCLADLGMLSNALESAKLAAGKSEASMEMEFDGQFLKLKAPKFRMKLITVVEDIISNSVDKPIQAVLTPEFELTTSSDIIKSVSSNSYIFSDPSSARVYVSMDPEMDKEDKNAVYAEVTNKSSDFNNSVKTKFGLADFGELKEEVIIDFQRLAVFNLANSKEIKIQKLGNGINALSSTVEVFSNPETFYKISVLCSTLKA